MKNFLRDPIYKNINIDDPLIIDLINAPEFQRLRYINQLSGARIVFPSAVHTRFSHSLGVYHLICRVFNEADIDPNITENEKRIIKIAGLLHDIGHGPFSHSFEQVLSINSQSINNHEQYGTEIIGNSNTTINVLLKKHQIDVELLKKIILNDLSVPKYLTALISSQLDCDRLDYLMRDSYFSGVSYGTIDIDWLIVNMNLSVKNGLVFNFRTIEAIENFLISRFHMYQQIYHHPSSILFEILLVKFFETIKKLNLKKYAFTVSLEPIMWFLKQKKINIQEYLIITEHSLLNFIFEIKNKESNTELKILANYLFNLPVFRVQKKANSGHVINLKKNIFAKEINNVFYIYDKSPILVYDQDRKITKIQLISQLIKLFKNYNKTTTYYFEITKQT